MDADGEGMRVEAAEHRYAHAALTERIIGVFYSVYNELGHGFLESVYEEAMVIALREAGLSVSRQAPIEVRFRAWVVGEFRADLLVDGAVLLELKAIRALEPGHEAQVLNYLRATAVEVGLLLNFGPKAQIKRLAFDNARKNRKGSDPDANSQGGAAQ